MSIRDELRAGASLALMIRSPRQWVEHARYTARGLEDALARALGEPAPSSYTRADVERWEAIGRGFLAELIPEQAARARDYWPNGPVHMARTPVPWRGPRIGGRPGYPGLIEITEPPEQYTPADVWRRNCPRCGEEHGEWWVIRFRADGMEGSFLVCDSCAREIEHAADHYLDITQETP